jgi:large subunit ribosomal protein L29
MKSTNEFLKELREKSAGELQTLLKEKRLHQFTLKMKLKTQQLTNSNEIRDTRRDIARILTILKEKEMQNA